MEAEDHTKYCNKRSNVEWFLSVWKQLQDFIFVYWPLYGKYIWGTWCIIDVHWRNSVFWMACYSWFVFYVFFFHIIFRPLSCWMTTLAFWKNHLDCSWLCRVLRRSWDLYKVMCNRLGQDVEDAEHAKKLRWLIVAAWWRQSIHDMWPCTCVISKTGQVSCLSFMSRPQPHR